MSNNAQPVVALAPTAPIQLVMEEGAPRMAMTVGGAGGAVVSVNGQTGAVVLPAPPVSSVNGKTGAVVLPTGVNWPSLYLAPAGATGEAFPRSFTAQGSFRPTSGTLCLSAIPLFAGIPINTLTFYVGGLSGEAGGSHGWYVLLDQNRKVVAVSADQTRPTFWGTSDAPVPLSVAASGYTTTYDGLYYGGYCIVATTTPAFTCCNTDSGTDGANSAAPILAGTSNTGLTTPPALGTVMNAISFNPGFHSYFYTS